MSERRNSIIPTEQVWASPEDYPQTPRYQWWRWHDAYGKEDVTWANVVDHAVVAPEL